jgi:hypothetical protein
MRRRLAAAEKTDAEEAAQERAETVKGGVKVDHWGGAKGYQQSER